MSKNTVTVSDTIKRYRAGCGVAQGAKRGRNPVFPYVPIIHHVNDRRACATGRNEQVRGFAYITWDEAVTKAQQVIDARVDHFTKMIAEPRHRALREQWGLPRELEVADAAK